jgi:hypothetical protein
LVRGEVPGVCEWGAGVVRVRCVGSAGEVRGKVRVRCLRGAGEVRVGCGIGAWQVPDRCTGYDVPWTFCSSLHICPSKTYSNLFGIFFWVFPLILKTKYQVFYFL